MTAKQNPVLLLCSLLIAMVMTSPQEAFPQPIMDAVKKEDVDAVRDILKRQPDEVNHRDAEGFTPLHHAVRSMQIGMTRYLLDHDANPSAVANNGMTPLHLVSHSEIARLLTRYDIPLNAQDTAGATPLHYIAERGRPGLAEVLYEKLAKLEIRDHNGMTPLLRAARSGTAAMVGWFIERGANLGAKDNAGRTALHWAAANTPQAAQQVADKGFNPNERDNLGRTALHYARNDSVVQILVAHNATVNVADLNGATPLHTAASAGLTTAVTGLAKAGATINAADAAGRTPLHYAVATGFEAVCRELLRLKADPSIKANDGLSAADLAQGSKNSAIKKLFPAASKGSSSKGSKGKGKKK